MNSLYLVTYVRHNKETGGLAYKTELATESLAEAKKKYHALMAEYTDNPTFDFASVVITDAYTNRVMGEFYEEEEEIAE